MAPEQEPRIDLITLPGREALRRLLADLEAAGAPESVWQDLAQHAERSLRWMAWRARRIEEEFEG